MVAVSKNTGKTPGIVSSWTLHGRVMGLNDIGGYLLHPITF